MTKEKKSLPRTLPAFIFFFVKQQRSSFSMMCLAGIFIAAYDALFPYFIKNLVNKIEKLTPGFDAPFRGLAFPLISLGIGWILMELARQLFNIVAAYAWPKFRKNIRATVFAYIQGQSHSYFSEHFTGGIANKITELPRSCERILDIIIGHFFCTAVAFFISLAVFFQVRAVFSIILFFFVVIFMSLVILNIRSVNNAAKIHADTIATLDGQIVDSLGCMLTVRLFARFQYELAYLDQYQTDEIKKSQKAAWTIIKVNIYCAIVIFIFSVITFFTLIYGWNHNWVSIGDFSLITMSFFNLIVWIWHGCFHLFQIAKQIGVSRAALSLLSEPQSIRNYPNAKPLVVTNGSICFDNVTFHYGASEFSAFNQVAVKIKGGQKVGLVGCSGSGKTTFVNLILRLYDLDSGKILVDDQEIACVTQESLRKQIAMIPQDPFLFHRTIFENIHYGRLEATEAEVLEAARLAYCSEFIEHLDHGFETIVGERGVKLSGGQRQRIAIARAILKDAPILIMDEATSALDSITEKLIQDSLQDLIQHRTTLVIAHRLSTINRMDRILVFNKGVIVEDGTVSALLAQRGQFAKLWEMQVDGFLFEREGS